MKKTKVVNTTIKPTKESNNVVRKAQWFDEYHDCKTLLMRPVSDVYLDKLAIELIEWVDASPNNLVLKQFTLAKGIPYMDYLRFVDRHENLKIAHQQALHALGVKREVGALTKVYESGMAIKALPMYDEAWKENLAWHASLNKNQVNETKQTIVVLEKFPEVEKQDV